MFNIQHKLTIKAPTDKVYDAITTQEGLESWWAKQTVAQPVVGFINIFTFGTIVNQIEVTGLETNQKLSWKIIRSNDEWTGTTIHFSLEEKNEKTVLRFDHEGWAAATDFYAECNFAWAKFMISLKSYCETGTGNPV